MALRCGAPVGRRALVWGLGSSGQLGLGHSTEWHTVPTYFPFADLRNLFVGLNHNILLSSKGMLLSLSFGLWVLEKEPVYVLQVVCLALGEIAAGS